MATFNGLKLSKEQMDSFKTNLIKVHNAFRLFSISSKEACDSFIQFRNVMGKIKVKNKFKLPLDKILAYKKGAKSPSLN